VAIVLFIENASALQPAERRASGREKIVAT
jgi:hypothetical protein